MITVSVWRKTLVRLDACSGPGSGLELFDRIASLQDAGDPLRLKRIRVQWSPLAEIWLAVGAPGFVGWLRQNKLVPRLDLRSADLRGADLRSANLCGADLGGALRRSDDAQIEGYEIRDGILRRKGGAS